MARRKQKPFFESVEVIDAGAKGKSVAKAPDGRIIFVDNAVPGDVIAVQTYKKRRGYYEGTATAFHKKSDKRSTPECQHFGICGGCKWQHMGYEHQLFYKEREVGNNLKRIGHLDLPGISPIIGAGKKYFYRNKMEYSFSDNRWLSLDEIQSGQNVTDKNALGFHIPGMWDKILDIEKCHLQPDPSNAIRLETKAFAEAHHLPFFNLRKQEGLLRTLMIRTATTGEVMVLIQFFEDDAENRKLLLEHLRITFPQINSLLYTINQKANDTLYDQDIICYSGTEHIYEEMEGLRFKITAKSFYQTNPEQAYELYKVTRILPNLQAKKWSMISTRVRGPLHSL